MINTWGGGAEPNLNQIKPLDPTTNDWKYRRQEIF